MKTIIENLANDLNKENIESLEVIREIIDISKNNYNYFELDQDFPGLLIDDNSELCMGSVELKITCLLNYKQT